MTLFLSVLTNMLFVINLYAQEPFTNMLGQFVENTNAKAPCWDLSAEEFSIVAPDCALSRRPLFGDYRQVFKQHILQKADEIYKSRLKCFSNTVKNLGEPSSKISQHYKENILSTLGLYFRTEGQLERLKTNRFKLANQSLVITEEKKRELFGDATVNPHVVKTAINNYDEEIAKLENRQAVYLESLIFADDEKVRDEILLWGQKALGTNKLNYSANESDIEKKLTEYWKKNNPMSSIVETLKVYNHSSNLNDAKYLAFLNSSGLAYEALDSLLADAQVDSSLKDKVRTCIAQNYGEVYQSLENAKDTGLNILYFAAGARATTGALHKVLLKTGLKFNFWVGGLTGLSLPHAPNMIGKDCLNKVDASRINLKNSCDKNSNSNLNEFYIEKMKYGSCAMSLLEVAIWK